MSEGYILLDLDAFISNSLQPEQLNGANSNEKDVINLKAELNIIQARCKELLMDRIFNIRKQKELRLFIQTFQLALAHIADKIFGYKLHFKENDDVIKFYDNVIHYTNELLDYIEQNFNEYINREQILPVYRLQKFKVFIQEQKESIISFFKIMKADDELISALEQLITLLEQDILQQKITIANYYYWNNLIKELTNTQFLFDNEDTFSNTVIPILFYLNLNHTSLFRYLINEMHKKIYQAKDDKEQLDKVLFYIKKIQQIPVINSMILYPKMSSLKEQVLIWLHEELHFFERRYHLFSEVNGNGKAILKDENTKLHTTLSVDQLSLIFRAAADVGIVEKKSYKSLFEKLAPFISTPYTKHISSGSMRTKAYTAENKDKQIVKDVLMELYKKVNQY